MALLTFPSSARRPLAALWFAAFAALSTFLFFLPLVKRPHVIILYMVLPSLAAGIAGYIWGGAIPDPSRVKTWGQSMLRGLMIGAATFVIFALLYAAVLPILEGQWSLGTVVGLFFLTLMFGIFMGGPLAAVSGITAGIALFKFSRHFVAEKGSPPSDASIV